MGKAFIIIVEDHDATREVMQFLLRCEGFEVWSAEDGEQALGLVLDRRPDLIVTDLMMPRMGGLELIRRVRHLPGCAELPIVVLSAYVGDYLQEATEAGATDVLRKPRDVTLLPETVDRLLGQRRKT